VSGDGDTCRRIDATARQRRGIIRARGWTVTVASRYAGLRGHLPEARAVRGDHRLRIVAAMSKAWLGSVALCLATTALGQPAGTASGGAHTAAPRSTSVPSIRLLHQQTGLAGTCGGSAFDVNTFIDVVASASADVKVTAPGVGLIEEFTDETGTNIGPYNAVYPTFHIPAFGGGLAPNTVITVAITTYSGPALSGKAIETSRIAFNCTTGALQPLAAGTAASVPMLSDAALAASALLLALLGAVALRRRKARC
jgi:hypothetical protein